PVLELVETRAKNSSESLVYKGFRRRELSVAAARFMVMSTPEPPQTSPAGDRFGAVLTQVRTDLAGLVDAQTWTLHDDELLARFGQAAAVKAAAEELMARLAADMTDRD